MKNLLKSDIGKRVKLAREKSGISAGRFIDQLGVSQQTLSKIEIGENFPSIQTLASIAVLCRVSTDYILYGEPSHAVQSETVKEEPSDAIQSKNKAA